MVRNQYEGGNITLPCAGGKGDSSGNDTFIVTSARSRMKVFSRGDSPAIRIEAELKGKIGELDCSSVLTREENRQFLDRLAQAVREHLEASLDFIRTRKADVIRAGEHVRRRHPQLWKRWSANWEEEFSRSRFETDVRILLTDTGLDTGEPFDGKPSS